MSILNEISPGGSLHRLRAPAQFLMALVLLLAYSFGLRGLNADVIWADELSSLAHMGAFGSHHSPMQVLESISLRARDHVPLYFLLGAGWSHLAGWSQFSMRYPSLLAGIAMIAALYGYARATVDKRTALIAAFLMANNAFVLVYFHEIRGYTLLLFLAIIHSWLYWRLNRGAGHSRLLLALFVVSGSAMLYTHVFGLVMLAALGATHILLDRRSSRTKLVLSGWTAGLALFLPHLWTMLSGAVTWGATERAVLATQLAEPLVALLTNGLGFLFIPLALNLAYRHWGKRHLEITKLLLLAAILGTAFLLVSWIFDLITLSRMRYFLLLWFPCMILFAYSITLLSRSTLLTVIFVLIWALAGISLGRSGQILQYAGFSAQSGEYPSLQYFTSSLKDKVNPGDFMVGFSKSLSLNEKREGYDWSISDYYLDAQLGIDGAFLHANLKRYRLTEDTRDILKAHPHILLAHDPSDVPLNYARTLAIVSEVLAPCDKLVDEPTLSIRKYAHPVMGCEHQSASIQYENGIRLIDRALEFDIDGQRIQALTWWEVPDAAMLNQYNVSLQIITSDSQNVRQIDRHLYDGLVPWSVIELSTANLPPDDYRLALILYNRENGSKVPGLDERSGESAGILPLLRFSIAA
ncbi:MAG: glycosyltransferase family 39 protein [Chloroflexota bacterium]|nr:glycosyltransferase family 39 protein [Chloroflexota bacterium]